jgi:AAA+ ATPase superfamily predicted ATPase
MENAELNNPFVVSGYHGPAYFCDRIKETEKIASALKNERNVALISPRRMGKTGLIHHVFRQLREENRDVRTFYIDVFATRNLNAFVNLLGKSVIGRLDDFSEATMKKITAFFKSVRPAFTFDPVTGAPTVTLNTQPEQSETTLEEIMEYMRQSGRRCYVAIDEFQQILEYPETGVEALLRSYTQLLPNVRFIFAGSKKHLMDAMFSEAKRPFYQSTQKTGLHEIAQDVYYDFAAGHFAAVGKCLPNNVFAYIYNLLYGHTWYIQMVLNHLYQMTTGEATERLVDDVTESILEEENATYKTYCESITKVQLSVLKAIASDGLVSQPFNADFMRRHNLSALSSIKQALKSLFNKTLLMKDDNNAYYVYDRFFALWLRQ